MKKYKAILFIILVIVFANTLTVVASTTGLPPADLFKVDIGFTSDIASPFFVVVNWFIGGYGLYLLGRSVWSLLKIVACLFTGGSLEGLVKQLKSLGIGVLILLITITGIWYKLIIVIWTRINPKLEEELSLLLFNTIQKIIEFV